MNEQQLATKIEIAIKNLYPNSEVLISGGFVVKFLVIVKDDSFNGENDRTIQDKIWNKLKEEISEFYLTKISLILSYTNEEFARYFGSHP